MARSDRLRERVDGPRAGRTFAGYELEELVHEGPLGRVYKARDVRLGRTVALRIVAPDIGRDAVARARLNRESTAVAQVDHPNVLPIYETGDHDGTLFIASRWVDGSRLSTLIREEGRIEPKRAVRIVNQVAWALQATHAQAIIHRNVSPASILVTPSDHVYLTDFGYARHLSDATLLVMREQLAEEVDYVAPEYIAGDAVDARADIYGVGCVLYEALTGEVPFPVAGVAAKSYAHRFTPPPSARRRAPDVPPALDAVIARALAKDPAERQQTAAELAIAAASAIQMTAPPWATRETDAVVRAPAAAGAAYAEPAYYTARPRRLRWWAFAAVFLVCVAAAVALMLTVG